MRGTWSARDASAPTILIARARVVSALVVIAASTFSVAGFGAEAVLIEAEQFDDLGGWVSDCQFMDQMGSPFLLAHGLGVPVEDATTQVELPATGTYRVRVRVDNRGEMRFLAGMVATVVFPYGRLEDVALVPAQALAQSEDGAYVFVVRDGKAREVAVDVLGRRDDLLALGSLELSPGDSVIVVGQGVVRDGEVVEVAAVR